MRADNPLTVHFLDNHPVDAARVLENLPVEHSVSFLEGIDDDTAARLVHFFMPSYAARCLMIMSTELLNHCTQQVLANVCRALTALQPEQQQSVIDRLSSRLARQVNSRLSYPGGGVGRYFNQSCPVLPASLTTAEALHQLEDIDYRDGCYLNVVDDNHRLLGNIDMARLLSAGRKDSLASLLSQHKRPAVLISSQMLELDEHRGWLSYRQLPVVDRNGVYMGELDYDIVREFQQEYRNPRRQTEAFGSLLSLAGVYWLSVSWLIDCLLGSDNQGGDDPS